MGQGFDDDGDDNDDDDAVMMMILIYASYMWYMGFLVLGYEIPKLETSPDTKTILNFSIFPILVLRLFGW